MGFYYYPYFWDVTTFLFFDLPLFLLIFGLVFIITKVVIRLPDPVMNTAIAAFAAALGYFVVRNSYSMSRWFYTNWNSLIGAVIVFVIFGLIYFMIKFR